jgi:hypothetical protein
MPIAGEDLPHHGSHEASAGGRIVCGHLKKTVNRFMMSDELSRSDSLSFSDSMPIVAASEQYRADEEIKRPQNEPG